MLDLHCVVAVYARKQSGKMAKVNEFYLDCWGKKKNKVTAGMKEGFNSLISPLSFIHRRAPHVHNRECCTKSNAPSSDVSSSHTLNSTATAVVSMPGFPLTLQQSFSCKASKFAAVHLVPTSLQSPFDARCGATSHLFNLIPSL